MSEEVVANNPSPNEGSDLFITRDNTPFAGERRYLDSFSLSSLLLAIPCCCTGFFGGRLLMLLVFYTSIAGKSGVQASNSTGLLIFGSIFFFVGGIFLARGKNIPPVFPSTYFCSAVGALTGVII